MAADDNGSATLSQPSSVPERAEKFSPMGCTHAQKALTEPISQKVNNLYIHPKPQTKWRKTMQCIEFGAKSKIKETGKTRKLHYLNLRDVRVSGHVRIT